MGVVEQRYQAVLEVLGGAAVTDVARRYGVARQTVHGWLRRYADQGLAGLVDRSSRPASCPHQMPVEVEARIVEMRRAHPSWDPRTIVYHIDQAGVVPLPSRSAVYRALLRHRLVDPQQRRKRRSDYRRWERDTAMELWQMDITGGVFLVDGVELKVVTGIDDHSRFCISAKVVRRATARPVCDALAEAMTRHGIPDQILTDNGKVFTGRFGPGKGEALFDRICRENGIRHLLTAPRSPTTTGKVERFHKTLKKDFLAGRTFESLEEAQKAIDGWVVEYNTDRPHQGIGGVPPIRRFELAVADPSRWSSATTSLRRSRWRWWPPSRVGSHEKWVRVVGSAWPHSPITLVGGWPAKPSTWSSPQTVWSRSPTGECWSPPTPANTHQKQNPVCGVVNLEQDLSDRPRWASQWCERSTRQVVSASLVSATGSATATVGSRSKSESSVTPWRSHKTANCFESTRPNTIRSKPTERSPTPAANPTGSTPRPNPRASVVEVPEPDCRPGTET
ncbi:MAG: IS481 family transposase [Acidimicrobiia bacterium]